MSSPTKHAVSNEKISITVTTVPDPAISRIKRQYL